MGSSWEAVLPIVRETILSQPKTSLARIKKWAPPPITHLQGDMNINTVDELVFGSINRGSR
jgi:hypothetical protein